MYLRLAVLVLLLAAAAAKAQTLTPRQACAEDYRRYCSSVQPGGGRVIACLKENAPKLTPGCREALERRS